MAVGFETITNCNKLCDDFQSSYWGRAEENRFGMDLLQAYTRACVAVFQAVKENNFDLKFAVGASPKLQTFGQTFNPTLYISIMDMGTWINVETSKWEGHRDGTCLQCGQEDYLECLCCEPVFN